MCDKYSRNCIPINIVHDSWILINSLGCKTLLHLFSENSTVITGHSYLNFCAHIIFFPCLVPFLESCSNAPLVLFMTTCYDKPYERDLQHSHHAWMIPADVELKTRRLTQMCCVCLCLAVLPQEQALHAVHSVVMLVDKDTSPRPEKHPGLQVGIIYRFF